MLVPTFLLGLTAEVTLEVFAFGNFSMGLKNSTSTALPPWAQNGHSPFAALLTTGESKTILTLRSLACDSYIISILYKAYTIGTYIYR